MPVGSYDDGKEAFVYNAGFRFPGVTIAKGSSISSATLTVIPIETIGTFNTVLRGVDEDNFSGWSSSVRPSTITATSAWTEWDDDTAWTLYVAKVSPNFSGLVEEIVGRSGWASGNALGIALINQGSGMQFRSIAFYEHATYDPPQLNITYTESGYVPSKISEGLAIAMAESGKGLGIFICEPGVG